MRTNLVYSIQITDYPREQFQQTPFPGTDLCDWRDDFEPEGWHEHCLDLWGEHRPFFWPSQKKMYRSRSSARDKQAIVRHWGGDARILVAEVGEFRDVEEVAAKRVRARRQAKIDKLQAQIDVLEAEESPSHLTPGVVEIQNDSGEPERILARVWTGRPDEA